MHDNLEISSDRDRLDLCLIHELLTDTYWARGRTTEEVKVSIENSVPFGLYHDDTQLGFARVLTDFIAIAYLLDVFVVPSYRNQGHGSKLVGHILASREFKNVGKWLLKSRDSQSLYERHGFVRLDAPEGLMEFIPERAPDAG